MNKREHARKRCPFGWAAIVLGLAWCLPVFSADPPPIHSEEVIDLQDGVKGQLKNLQRRLQDVAERLANISQADAEKVSQVDARLTHRDLVNQMEKIKEKLRDGSFKSAYEMQTGLVAQLKLIINELEGRAPGAQDWAEKLDKVRDAGKQVRQLLDTQKALQDQAGGSVKAQREANALSGMAGDIQSLLDKQQALSEKLPEGRLDDERLAGSLDKQLESLRFRQKALLDDVASSPDRQALTDVKSRAEALEKELTEGQGQPGKDIETQAKQVSDDIRQVLDDKPTADKFSDEWRDKAPGWQDRVKRALQQVKAKSAKGALLSAQVPPQASLAYDVKVTSEWVADKLAGSAGKNKEALDRGQAALKDAQAAMKDASDALGQGRKKDAMEAQNKAVENLQSARKAFDQFNSALKARGPFERAAHEQNQIKAGTDALKEKTRMLRKKEPDRDMADALSDVEDKLNQASDAMDRAANQFGRQDGQGKDAAGQAAQALKAAQDALKKEAAKRLKRLDDLNALAKKQNQLRQKTRTLSQAFNRGEDAPLRRAGDQLERAEKEMGRASSDFDKRNAMDGARAQDKAADELKRAEKALNDEADELERLKQEEELTDMVALLVRIRDDQAGILKEVIQADAERNASGRLLRPQKMRLAQLARRQKNLLGECEKVKTLLAREKAQVYAYVVDDIMGDMIQMQEGLSGRNPDTGRFIQILGTQVVDNINQLLNALKDELARRKDQEQKQNQQQGGQQGKRVLIPPVAEALMLKRMQLALNGQTENLERSRQANDGKLNPAMERRLTRLALKQGALESLTRKVAEEFLGPPPVEGQTNGEEEDNAETAE